MEKNKWNTLSLRDKANLMRVFVKEGITSLKDMEDRYNSFALGGPEDDLDSLRTQYLNETDSSEANSLGRELAAQTIDKYRDTQSDPFTAERLISTKPNIESFLLNSHFRENEDAKGVTDFFTSYGRSKGLDRIISNQKNFYKSNHSFLDSLENPYEGARTKELIQKATSRPVTMFKTNVPTDESFYDQPGNAIYMGSKKTRSTPYDFIMGHEYGHSTNRAAVTRGQREVLNQNTNTEAGHDSRLEEKHADIQGLKYFLYKEGIYDARGNKDVTPAQIKMLRAKYPDIRPLQQMTDEEAAFQVNNVAQNITDMNTSNISAYGGPINIYGPGGFEDNWFMKGLREARDAKIGAVGAENIRQMYSDGNIEDAQAMAQALTQANIIGATVPLGLNTARVSSTARKAMDVLGAIDSYKNIVSENGIQKTWRKAKEGDTWGAVKSGIGDILDMAALGDLGYQEYKLLKNFNTMRKGIKPSYISMPDEYIPSISSHSLPSAQNSVIKSTSRVRYPSSQKSKLLWSNSQSTLPSASEIKSITAADEIKQITAGLEPERIADRREILKRINRVNKKYNAPLINLDASATPAEFENAIDKSIKQYNTYMRGVRPKRFDTLFPEEEKLRRMQNYAIRYSLGKDTKAGRAGLYGYDTNKVGTIYAMNSYDSTSGYANKKNPGEYQGKIAKIRFKMKNRDMFPTAEDYFAENIPYFDNNMENMFIDRAIIKSPISPSKIFNEKIGVSYVDNPKLDKYKNNGLKPIRPIRPNYDADADFKKKYFNENGKSYNYIKKDLDAAIQKYTDFLKAHPGYNKEKVYYKIDNFNKKSQDLLNMTLYQGIKSYNKNDLLKRKRDIINKLYEKVPGKVPKYIDSATKAKYVKNHPEYFNLSINDLKYSGPKFITSESIKRGKTTTGDPRYQHYILLGKDGDVGADFLEWVDPIPGYTDRSHHGHYFPGLSTKTFKNGGYMNRFDDGGFENFLSGLREARDSRIGAVGAEPIRQMYAKGDIEEANKLSQQLAGANALSAALGIGMAPGALDALSTAGNRFLTSNIANWDDPALWSKGLATMFPKYAKGIKEAGKYIGTGLASYYGGKSADNLIHNRNQGAAKGADIVGVTMPLLAPAAVGAERLSRKLKNSDLSIADLFFRKYDDVSNTLYDDYLIKSERLKKDKNFHKEHLETEMNRYPWDVKAKDINFYNDNDITFTDNVDFTLPSGETVNIPVDTKNTGYSKFRALALDPEGNSEKILYSELRDRIKGNYYTEKSGIYNIPEYNEENSRVIKKYADEANEFIGDLGYVAGSSKTIGEGYFGGVPGDIEIVTTKQNYNKLKNKIGFVLSKEEALAHSGKSRIAAQEGKTDIQVVGESIIDGKRVATGNLAHELYRTLDPEGSAKYYSDNILRGIEFEDLPIPKGDGTYYTPEELVSKIKKEKLEGMNILVDALSTHKSYKGPGTIKFNRPIAILTNTSTKAKTDVARAIEIMGKSKLGKEYKSAVDMYPNLNFDDIENNKEFLKKLKLPLSIANDKEAMKNIVNYYNLQMTATARSVNDADSYPILEQMANSLYAPKWGHAAGGGGNALIPGGDLATEHKRFQHTMSQFPLNPNVSAIKKPTDIFDSIKRESRYRMFNQEEKVKIKDVFKKYNLEDPKVNGLEELHQLLGDYNNPDLTEDIGKALNINGVFSNGYWGRYFGRYSSDHGAITYRYAKHTDNAYELGRPLHVYSEKLNNYYEKMPSYMPEEYKKIVNKSKKYLSDYIKTGKSDVLHSNNISEIRKINTYINDINSDLDELEIRFSGNHKILKEIENFKIGLVSAIEGIGIAAGTIGLPFGGAALSKWGRERKKKKEEDKKRYEKLNNIIEGKELISK